MLRTKKRLGPIENQTLTVTTSPRLERIHTAIRPVPGDGNCFYMYYLLIFDC